MLFEDKKNLLELYNAISGKHYTDPELLEINTLENAIYMSIKNDVSFLIDGRLSLYGIKPGLTGMWQVNGRSLVTDFEKIVELDVEYIDNWSLMEDIRILCSLMFEEPWLSGVHR